VKGAVIPLAHVPDRDMRRDTATDEPTEELAGAIGGISSEPFGLKSQSFISPLDHSFRRRDLIVGSGRGGLHIDDHCVIDVDQVIEPIAKLDALVGSSRPSMDPPARSPSAACDRR
jgi:hypothetical protein